MAAVSAEPTLVLDTATSRTVVGLDGLERGRRFVRCDVAAGRHGGELLPAIAACFAGAGRGVEAIGRVVVGTGPGSFTGLRIGLAAAKTIAYSRSLPIVGVPTAAALARAALGAGVGGEVLVAQPAGPSGRYLTRVGLGPGADPGGLAYELPEPSAIVPPGSSLPEAAGDALLVTVDLDEDESLPAEARERGRAALLGLGEALAALGQARLARGESDDVAELVPGYVTIPRGVGEVAAAVAWAPELR